MKPHCIKALSELMDKRQISTFITLYTCMCSFLTQVVSFIQSFRRKFITEKNIDGYIDIIKTRRLSNITTFFNWFFCFLGWFCMKLTPTIPASMVDWYVLPVFQLKWLISYLIIYTVFVLRFYIVYHLIFSIFQLNNLTSF